MFKFLRRVLNRETARDIAQYFPDYEKLAKIYAGTYLHQWFAKIFSSPNYKELFADEPDMAPLLAAQVVNYLFAEDINEMLNNQGSEVLKKRIERVERFIPKWADDAVKQDPMLAELVIQTLRMEMILRLESQGRGWLQSPRGVRVLEILKTYGGGVKKSLSPRSYRLLMDRWHRLMQNNFD